MKSFKRRTLSIIIGLLLGACLFAGCAPSLTALSPADGTSYEQDAATELSDYTISRLTLEVYEPYRDSGDMAPEPPEEGFYSYELTANGDGTGRISSNFFREVNVSASQLEDLSEIIKASGLMSINGVDIITEDVPDDTVFYDLSIDFASGESYHSRANLTDVPYIWNTAGRELHKYLFDIFTDAGYNYYTGEFHSTEPLRRIGPGSGASCGYGMWAESVRIEKESVSYEYTLYSEYPVFHATGDAPDALVNTLNEISEHYKTLAEADLEEEFKVMEAVPESTWKPEEHRSTYSFYAVIHEKTDDTKYYFWISEGHANCFGLGEHGSGDYSYIRYCIDAESGKLLSLSDFFTDGAALCERVTELLSGYNRSDEKTALLYSDEYQKKLREYLQMPETDGGIGFEPFDDGIGLYVSEDFDTQLFYPYGLKLYYEDVQDILSDQYAFLRGIER